MTVRHEVAESGCHHEDVIVLAPDSRPLLRHPVPAPSYHLVQEIQLSHLYVAVTSTGK